MIGAFDISGDEFTGNYKYMGIVIGAIESINSILKSLNYTPSQSKRTNKRNLRSVIHKLKFNEADCIIFCIRIDKNILTDKIREPRMAKKGNISKKRIYQMYNRQIWAQLKDKIGEFANQHDMTLRELIFYVDDDCVDFAKDNGLKYDLNEDVIHLLADAIAWTNNKGKEPKGVIKIDLRDLIREKLRGIK